MLGNGDLLVLLFNHMLSFTSGDPLLLRPIARKMLFLLSVRVLFSLALALALGFSDAIADVASPTENGNIQGPTRVNLIALISPGVGHMIGNLGHMLFLFGIVFFLFRLQHIGAYLGFFWFGHFVAMILGIYFGVGADSYLLNVMIGLSMIYKAMSYLDAFQRWRIIQSNLGSATVVFGLIHGIGLAYNILEYQILPYGLVRSFSA
ncbi:HupE/UreJ family protein [Hydrogenophaga sp. NFH-34]|uniref:HupE/UreJ family protein n=1 Tax=Hydrogenophaga sp. NFH-34 TaxID=2744446 RepID=UPI001F39DABC|nr:HupE/UreJ family protein [Hydrogenophaga sp. NFH-34]